MIQIIIDGTKNNGEEVHEIFEQDELFEAIEFLTQLNEEEENGAIL